MEKMMRTIDFRVSGWLGSFGSVKGASWCFPRWARALTAILLLSLSPAFAQTAVVEAPSGLWATSVTEAGISLSWTAPASAPVRGYNLLRCVEGESQCTPVWLAWVSAGPGDPPPAPTTYTDAGVQGGTTYRYAVEAKVGNYYQGSPWSNQITVRAMAVSTPSSADPSQATHAPTGLRGASGDAGISLSWVAPADVSVRGYNLLRCVEGESPCTPVWLAWVSAGLGDPPPAPTTYVDANVQAGRTYRYAVEAKVRDNYDGSPWSNQITVLASSTIAGPQGSASPTGLGVVAASETEVSLSWTAPADVSVRGYNLLRCVEDGEVCTLEWLAWVSAGEGDPAPAPTSYADTAVEAGGIYHYAVEAKVGDDYEATPWSNRITVDPLRGSVWRADYRASGSQTIWRGVDLSYVNELEDCGAVYRADGEVGDPYELLSNAGANLVRLRLWHTPDWTNYSTLSDVTRSIRRAKALDQRVLLNFHYSDDWADVETQVVPAAWRGTETTEELARSLYDYTLSVLTSLYSENLAPDYVQVGNETNAELLLPDKASSARGINWERNVELLNAGIRAVRDFGAQSETTPGILLHVAQPENVWWWFDAAFNSGVLHFDIVAFSYYSSWSSVPLGAIQGAVSEMRQRYGKDVVIAETAYPWTLQGNDSAPNLAGEGAVVEGYPATIDGQRRYNMDLMQAVLDGGGLGTVYWEPAWITTSCGTRWGQGSHGENLAFFDYVHSELHEGAEYLGQEYTLQDQGDGDPVCETDCDGDGDGDGDGNS